MQNQNNKEGYNAGPKNKPWHAYLLAHLGAGLSLLLCALLTDNLMRQFGIDIHPWKEALASSLAGIVFAAPLLLVLWRLGLVTIPQYMLGAITLFIPATLLSLIGIYFFEPILIEISGMNVNNTSQSWAATIYLRIARSAVLFPVYIVAFWYIYHKRMNRIHFI